MPYERVVVWSFRAVLLATFVASVTTVFVGCRPFSRYWQISPDPGDWYDNSNNTTTKSNTYSVVGNLWLITYETSNIVTDLMLMALSFVLIFSVTVSLKQ